MGMNLAAETMREVCRYSNNFVLTGSEPPNCVNARRSPQGMAPQALAKDCNTAVAPLGGSRWARREALICGVALACISDG